MVGIKPVNFVMAPVENVSYSTFFGPDQNKCIFFLMFGAVPAESQNLTHTLKKNVCKDLSIIGQKSLWWDDAAKY